MANSIQTGQYDMNDIFAIYELAIPRSVRFWWYLILNICSLICSLSVLYQLLFHRKLRQALNNHVIIVLLFVGLIYESLSVPFMLHFYRVGYSWNITTSFGHFWQFMDYTSYTISLVGFAWATIERHILIFHQQWIATRRQRFFVHYLPIMAIVVYSIMYWFLLIFFPACEDRIFLQPMNGVPAPCMAYQLFWGKWNTVCHLILPTFIITIFSSALLFRILWQKTRLNRSIQWRQNRKMTIQLVLISLLYLFFNLPRSILISVTVDGRSLYLIIQLLMHLAFFAVQLIFFLPFICYMTIPGSGKRLKKLLLLKSGRNMIWPIGVTAGRENNNQTGQKETHMT
ncbi:unnamed protein product [Adineta ricciae]|uniref:G-protein coupled receptors family 1 profile domain-containing protein n=1 Tax=Adineta ricciae TaxID=249248 RepID=A0A815DGC0_ADIRI|nr:unnamed protein product [Adineta ricciae]CAF1442664.1 unnamed protein product [Adineta ricciae]